VVAAGDEPAVAPLALAVSPNPAFGAVRFSIDVSGAAHGAQAILVFSASGRRVARIPAGGGNLVWNGRDESGHLVASGIYFARLEGSYSTSGTKFMMLH
jgi:hypothetical protein